MYELIFSLSSFNYLKSHNNTSIKANEKQSNSSKYSFYQIEMQILDHRIDPDEPSSPSTPRHLNAECSGHTYYETSL
jgi:hypothetical protein